MKNKKDFEAGWQSGHKQTIEDMLPDLRYIRANIPINELFADKIEIRTELKRVINRLEKELNEK